MLKVWVKRLGAGVFNFRFFSRRFSELSGRRTRGYYFEENSSKVLSE